MQPTDQELLSCLKLDDQNHWVLKTLEGKGHDNFYLILCDFGSEKVEEVTDQQLAGVVAELHNHMTSLSKTCIVFENAGNGFHHHTLAFVDRMVKLLVANHSVSIDHIHFIVGIVSHEKNISIYEKICTDNNFSRLKLIFSSGGEGQLNAAIFSIGGYQHPEVNLVSKIKNKKFTAINCESLKSYVNNFEEVASELDFQHVSNLTVSNQTKDFYENSYFTLTMEEMVYKNTESVGPLDCWRFGHKTFSPMAFRHAFILLARPGALSILRDMGYKTFHPFIDESYDEIQNDQARFYAVLDETERLCSLNDQEWLDFQNNVLEIVDYNFERLKSKPYDIVFENEINSIYKSA